MPRITRRKLKQWEPLGLAAVLSLLIVLVVFAVAMHLTDEQYISRDELSRNLEELQSYAAEGAYLAEYSTQNKAPRKYVEAYGSSLQEASDSISERLDEHAHERDLSKKVEKTVDIADDLTAKLQILSTAPQDQWPPHLGQTFKNLADQADEVLESI